MAEHNVRIVLEAISKGSGNLRNFFRDSDSEIRKFRSSVRAAQKEVETFAGFGGTTTGRGPGGRFVSLKKDVDESTNSLRRFREEFRRTFTQGPTGRVLGGIRAGLSEEARIREEVNRRLNLSEEARQRKIDKLDEETHNRKLKRINDLEEAEVGSIRRLIAAEEGRALSDTRVERSRGRVVQHQINLIERLQAEKKLLSKEERRAATDNLKDLFEERDAIDAVIRARNTERDAIVDNEKRKIAALHARIREEENTRRRGLRAAILRPSGVTTEQQVRSEFGQDIDRDSDSFRRLGASAARAFGQIRTGFGLARNGLTDNERLLLRNSNAVTRFGANVGRTIGSIRPFRGITLLLVGTLQVFLTLLVQVGAALVALASSAILAAAALGGALLAGLVQLVPVVALLAAAFSRLGKVLDAANLADKLALTKGEDQKTKLDSIRQATQRLADSRYSLLKAGEAVKDAEFDLAQAHQDVLNAVRDQQKAVKDLAEARRQAARDIVDANLEEREAALALQEAELGILEAKRRLREEEQRAQLGGENIEDAKAQVKEAQARLVQARTEGDTSEITLALQQLSIAEQDLQQIKAQADDTRSTIRQAQIDVKQAELNQQQAVIRNKRAQEDAAETRKRGVEGSDRVVAAQETLANATKNIAQAERQQVLATRGLRDSVHALAIAKREEKDAELELTDARKKATSQQEQLQQALGDLSPAEKRLFRSIQRIKEIYKKNFRPITDIIINSFADAINKIAPLLQDPKILNGARQLATAIAESVNKLADFAVSPEFKRFLTFSLGEAAENVPKITDGFIDLGRVLIRVARAATPLFNALIDRFVGFLDKLEKRTKDSSGLEKFFATAGRHLDSWLAFAVAVGRVLGFLIKFSAPSGKGLLDDLTAKLNEWADWLKENEPIVREFFARTRVQVGDLARVLTRMTVVLFKAFSSEGAARLTTFILDTLIPAFALFLQLLSLIAGGLIAIFSIPVVGPFVQNIVKFGLALLFMIKLLKTLGPLWAAFNLALTVVTSNTAKALIVTTLSKALAGLAIAIRVVGIALRFVFITNPWIAVIAGIIAAVILLDRKFHFLRPTLEFLLRIFRKVFNFIKDHWKLLIAILLGPFGLVIIGIIKWRDRILEIFGKIVNFIKDHWKLIVAILLAPFAIAGAIILGLIKWRERILEFFKAIPGKIVSFFESIPGKLKKIFDKIPGLLRDALAGLGGIVVAAVEKIPGGKKILGLFGVGGKSKEEEFADFLKDPILDVQDVKKAKRLKNKGLELPEIIKKLVEDQGISTEDARTLLSKYAFAHGGTVPGGEGSPVPILAHAGEWVLNKEQQARIAQALGISIKQAKNIIFGTKMDEKGKQQAQGLRDAPNERPFSGTSSAFGEPTSFNLVPKTDPDGIVVWFIEMADGAFGQVSPRDARRIIESKGRFIPGYVRRSTHGFTFRQRPEDRRGGFAAGGVVQNFLKGGVVASRWAGPMIQSFAEGGTVLQQGGFGSPGVTTNTKNIEQNFNVTAQGETDWNYILRLGAIHAQASYT